MSAETKPIAGPLDAAVSLAPADVEQRRRDRAADERAREAHGVRHVVLREIAKRAVGVAAAIAIVLVLAGLGLTPTKLQRPQPVAPSVGAQRCAITPNDALCKLQHAHELYLAGALQRDEYERQRALLVP